MKKLALVCVLVLMLCAGCTSAANVNSTANAKPTVNVKLTAGFELTVDGEPTVYESGDYKYCLLEDGTAVIAGYDGNAVDLIIPTELDGHRVTVIGDWGLSYCKSTTSVTIPDGVTCILTSAFNSCYALESVTIPDSVIFFGTHVFSGCSRLTSITIPDSVTTIGAYEFKDCLRLNSITIPDSVTFIGEHAFRDCPNITLTVDRGSYAEQYAIDNHLSYTNEKPALPSAYGRQGEPFNARTVSKTKIGKHHD